MSITTKAEAFQAIETCDFRIMPQEAVRFLYDHAPDEEIVQKVIYFLSNAYFPTEAFIEEYGEDSMAAALWYAVIAEKHHSEELISVLIDQLYGGVEFIEDEVFHDLDYQGEMLVSVLCQAYGEVAIDQFLKKMVFDANEVNHSRLVLNLRDTIYHTNETHIPILREILTSNRCQELELVCRVVANKAYKALIPEIEAFYVYLVQNDNRDGFFQEIGSRETGIALYELKSGDYSHPEFQVSQYEQKPSWEERLVSYLPNKPAVPEKSEAEMVAWMKQINKEGERNRRVLAEMRKKVLEQEVKPKMPKVGRNAPCPCGSGKKYKRCHGKK